MSGNVCCQEGAADGEAQWGAEGFASLCWERKLEGAAQPGPQRGSRAVTGSSALYTCRCVPFPEIHLRAAESSPDASDEDMAIGDMYEPTIQIDVDLGGLRARAYKHI